MQGGQDGQHFGHSELNQLCVTYKLGKLIVNMEETWLVL